MSEHRTRLSAGGRIVIPAELRREMHVSEGDDLILVLEDDGVRLLTPEQAVRRARNIVARYVPDTRRLADELIAERRREAADE